MREVEARSLRTEQCYIKRLVMGKTDIEAYIDPRTERCRELARDGPTVNARSARKSGI